MTEVFSKTPIGNLCFQFTQTLIAHPMSLYFRKPTTDEGYLKIIKHPMDFDTIRKRIKEGHYNSYKDWKRDVDLVYSNAIQYNTLNPIICGIAIFLREKTEKMCKKFSYFNHQNYEEAIRAANREIDEIVAELSQQEIITTPEYNVQKLSEKLNTFQDTSEVEQTIKKCGDQRILKKSKDCVINLDNLSRKTLDALWQKFGES